MLFFNKLTLKIHCWGGFGSQLLALNYYLRVKKKFPKKKVVLILHSGGITARGPELDFLEDHINLIKIDDFDNNSSTDLSFQNKYLQAKSIIRVGIKHIFNTLRIVITNDISALDTRPWTLAVRCTYTRNSISKQELTSLAQIIGIETDRPLQNFIGVHYRLGDLISQKPESLVPSDLISRLIHKISKNDENVVKVKIYSDSKIEYGNLKLPSKIKREWNSVDTLETIRSLIKAQYFIGTNSKVSLWIAIFRLNYSIPGDVYLPLNMALNIKKILDLNDRFNFETIKTY